MSLRVLICVTHLLGVGHLTRAASLARAFAQAGHEAILVSGGMPSALANQDGLDFVQLPPVRILGTRFTELLDEAGAPVTAAWMDARERVLLAALARTRPHVVVTELFPFGRRALEREFLALIETARSLHPRPLVLASVRDILVAPRKPCRLAQAHRRLADLYDGVLVHGDPHVLPLEASWPLDESLRDRLRYTGYVGDGRESAGARSGENEGRDEVEILVSAGGSAAGLPLLLAASEAAGLMPDRTWRILAGAGIPIDDLRRLRAHAAPNATVESARADFPSLLAGCAVSVSQAGYNTVVDVLRTGARAVLVPFEGGDESEQRLRAQGLRARSRAVVLPEAELTPHALAGAVHRALAAPRPQPLAFDGAARTVAIVEDMTRFGAPTPVGPGFDLTPLDAALQRLADSGRRLAAWVRDDDAVAATPALERLMAMMRDLDAPLALAAVPARLEPSLAERLAPEPRVSVLVHGLAHRDHAPAGEKQAEFGPHRPPEALACDARAGLDLCRSAFARQWLPIFVPPWNRIAPGFVDTLPSLGFSGLSTFGDRPACSPAPGLVQVNTHLDPIDWHGGRGLLDPSSLAVAFAGAVDARLSGRADPREPIGLLTHHLAHDESIWRFCAALLARLRRCPHIFWPSPDQLIRDPTAR